MEKSCEISPLCFRKKERKKYAFFLFFFWSDNEERKRARRRRRLGERFVEFDREVRRYLFHSHFAEIEFE